MKTKLMIPNQYILLINKLSGLKSFIIKLSIESTLWFYFKEFIIIILKIYNYFLGKSDNFNIHSGQSIDIYIKEHLLIY